MDSFRILRLWAAAAWSDGELHPVEAAALERFIAASDDLSDAQREEGARFLSARPVVDVGEARKLSVEAREGVYRAALAIVRLDRKVTDDERVFLQRLRAALELDDATLARVDAELPER
jgi:uncharacterized membrane protein YebE (DUF533 family)